MLCTFYILQSVFATEEDILWKDEIESFMQSKTKTFDLVIEIFWKIIVLRKDLENVDVFDELIEDLESKYFLEIGFKERKEIYQYTINICILLIVRKNHVQYNPLIFQLYKIALMSNYLAEDGNYIHHRTFKNIIRSAVNNGELEWTRKTLKNLKTFINKNSYQDAFNYNSGVYFYFIKDYDKALKHFAFLNYDNLFYSIDLRVYVLKIYFETDELDLLFTLIESFRAYLKRNKTLSNVMITSFRNFINNLKRVASINRRDKKKLKKLLIKVEEQNPVIEKKWILKEIEKRILNK